MSQDQQSASVEARRKFLQTAGKAAAAAPAVTLLMSAGRANAQAVDPYGPTGGGQGPATGGGN